MEVYRVCDCLAFPQTNPLICSHINLRQAGPNYNSYNLVANPNWQTQVGTVNSCPEVGYRASATASTATIMYHR